MQVQVDEHAEPKRAARLNGRGSLLLRMYISMVRIRTTEERIAEMVEAGEVRTPCHLYIGQEAVAVGVSAALAPGDTVWGNHRSHGHYLARGGDLRALVAEILCKATGCSGGRGGSMHLVAPEVGILGTAPIVAATVPLAVGAALAAKLRADTAVSVAFFGDGCVEEGHVHESLNLAALLRLPVVFVCENNLYASHMSLAERRLRDNLFEAGSFHGIRSKRDDGNDVLAVHKAAREAVNQARLGGGPSFLEFRTFRWRGHVGPSWDMDVGLKRRDELKDWLPKDPVGRARMRLAESGFDAAAFDDIQRAVDDEVAEAVEFARRSPDPQPAAVLDHVFSTDASLSEAIPCER